MPRFVAALIVAIACVTGARASAQAAPARDGVATLLRELERVIQASDWEAFNRLLSVSAEPRRMASFFQVQVPSGATRIVVQERDRSPMIGAPPDRGYRLVAEMFAEYGNRARVATLTIDVKVVGDPGDETWILADIDVVSSLENLYRLSLNPAKQFHATNLTVSAEDLDLVLPDGDVFVVDTDYGPTGVVLVGRGEMRFHPAPETERGQVKIFSGSDTLVTPFTTAFLRMSPFDFETRVSQAQLTARAVDASTFKRAQETFREDSPESFHLELGDLTRDSWSILPTSGDFLADVHTRKFDRLTYARSQSEVEDINLFDRQKRRNIALYASAQKVAMHGRYFSDAPATDIDVLRYDIQLDVQPKREWIAGVAKVELRVLSTTAGTITLKLADPLAVQSVTAEGYGRLLTLRVRGQNALVVHLPPAVQPGAEVALTIAYSGRLEAQAADRETLDMQRGEVRMAGEEQSPFKPEDNWLYSNRAFWYPQPAGSDYATARIEISVPTTLECVASGELEEGTPYAVEPAEGSVEPRKRYVFQAAQPLRYLAFLVSKFERVETVTVSLVDAIGGAQPGEPLMIGPVYDTVSLAVDANTRQAYRGAEVRDQVVGITAFYSQLIGDYPYPSLTVSLVESDLPGGHSPAYFAALNQVLATSQLQWRSDPSAFTHYPEFFVAHEVAHQWWGQAVGWRNYHEQWLSEGFSQYFAALYANHARGEAVFDDVLKQMRRWALSASSQGPIYLGYRVGHVKNDSRMFRAVIYNKGAIVLHMLRRLVGDEAFFGGLRTFYREWRFKRAGTEDFRAVMERATGRSLERFFEQWVYNQRVPQVRFSWRPEQGADGPAVLLHFEQVGEVFDLPATVRLIYADKRTQDVLVPLSEASHDVRVALKGALKTVELRVDDGMVAEIVK